MGTARVRRQLAYLFSRDFAEQVLAALCLLHCLRVPWGPRELPPPRRFGRYAERVAASWLRAHGHRILRTNWRWGRRGELDIVSREGDTLVITEVKSALGTRGGAPARHVDRHKRELLRHGAHNWLRLLNSPRPVPVRFDIIEIYLPAAGIPEVEQLVNAFPLKDK